MSNISDSKSVSSSIASDSEAETRMGTSAQRDVIPNKNGFLQELMRMKQGKSYQNRKIATSERPGGVEEGQVRLRLAYSQSHLGYTGTPVELAHDTWKPLVDESIEDYVAVLKVLAAKCLPITILSDVTYEKYLSKQLLRHTDVNPKGFGEYDIIMKPF
ncbi:hypothetical protein NDU88_007082 [Pleurodeles waltl]|uniref:Uncharacterized protein n=1 Tax=Pleurodeles waltl TaxID=8319 RepID=A0AAV7VRH3_PLEWA|nr:hypothetical protein NDU88_007082 [Pleurodeles waltl]